MTTGSSGYDDVSMVSFNDEVHEPACGTRSTQNTFINPEFIYIAFND